MKQTKLKSLLKEAKSKVLAKNRSACTIVLAKRDYKFERDLMNKTQIPGYQHGKTKDGKYKYKFSDDFHWERALHLLGAL